MERCEECGGVLTLIGGYDYYCPNCVVIDGKKGGEIVALMLGGIPPKEEEKVMSEPKTIEVQIFVRHRDEHGNITGKGFNQVLAFDAENGLRFARERFAQEVFPTTSNVGPKFTPRLSPKLVRQYVYDWLVSMVMERMGRANE